MSVLSRIGLALALTGLGVPSLVAPAAAETPQVASACAGVDAQARSALFTDWPGVSHLRRITQVVHVGKAPMHRTAGVALRVPARAGLSSAYLQRVAGCHIAMAATEGGDRALAVPGIRAQVSSRHDGYAVRIVSDNVSSAQELVRRMGL